MTDKEKQYLIAEIERLKDCASPIVVCDTLLSLIDSMQENLCDGCINRKGCITCENGELRETVQEEPVSIWHDGCEIPKSGTNILIIRKDENDSNYPPIAGCFHGTNSRLDGRNWGYYNGFCYNEIEPPVKWAYIDDILNLSNVERTVKKWKEEPVSDDFKLFEKEYLEKEEDEILCVYDRHAGLVDGAQWQKEQFEKNRLKHCNSITNEQAELEQGFIDQHLDKNKRMPTFLDAIEYGMKLQKEQMMANAVDGEVGYWNQRGLSVLMSLPREFEEDDKCKIILIKED